MRNSIAIVLILTNLFIIETTNGQQVYTWDHFVSLVEKIERHQLIETKPLDVITNYIRKLGYDNNLWTTLLGAQSESLPDGILTPTEKSLLTNMVTHGFSGQRELGVVRTPFGDVAMGPVIRGICAGLNRTTNITIPNTPFQAGDNLYLATLTLDLGLTTLVKRKSPSSVLLGPGGTWSPNTQCPEYFTTNGQVSQATDAQILGGIDGFLLGYKILEWRRHGVRLGQLFRMYYQGGVVYDRNFAACRRINTFRSISNNDFGSQIFMATHGVRASSMFSKGWDFSSIPISGISLLAVNTGRQFYSYTYNIQTKYGSCMGIGDEGCSLSANIVFVLDESGSIGAVNYEVEKDFVQKVISAFDVSPYSIRVGVVEYSSFAQEAIKLDDYSSRSPLICAVARLGFAGGGTATSAALIKAFDVLNNASKASSKHDSQIMILLTDGHSNGGIGALKPIVERIKKQQKGLTIVAVGVGGYNRAELELIATDPQKHVLTTSDFSRLISLVRLLRNETCETATDLQPDLSVNDPKTNYDVKITLYVGPGKTRYFKIPSATLISTENLVIKINATYGTITVYFSRTDATPGEDSYDSKYQVNADWIDKNSVDGKVIIFKKLCKGYSHGTCPPLYIGVVGQNSSNACSDRDCSVPNKIKIKIKAEYSGHCMSSPCANGTCHATTNGYYCTCLPGHYGSKCDSRLRCSSDACRNGGTCQQTQAGFQCICPYGYSGKRCETDLKTRVTCDPKFMEIELTRSYFSHIDYRNLHLIDPSCRATMVTSNYIRMRMSLDGCGTNHTERNDILEFWNQVNSDLRYISPNQTITRAQTNLVRFHCKFTRRELVSSTSFSPSKHTVHVSDDNFGNFTFNMNLFKSGNYKNSYLPFEYPVKVAINDPIWIEYRVQDSNGDLVVFADNCRATTSTDPNSSPQYEFLKDGCALDSTMNYKYDPTSSVQQFSIKSFRFIYTNSKLVYLHCELLVCLRNSLKSRCSRGCSVSARKRREVGAYDDTSDRHDLSVGPFNGKGDYNLEKTKSENSKDNAGTNTIMTASLGVVGGLLILAIALLVAFKIYPWLKDRPSVPATVNAYENHGSPTDSDEKIDSCEMQNKI